LRRIAPRTISDYYALRRIAPRTISEIVLGANLLKA
jgi:hypothetical protein